MKYKNLFYFAQLNSIGGVETFFYYLARKYADKDIVIVFREGDDEQVKRLRQYVRVSKFNGQRYECERAFFNYNTDIIDHVDADEYIQILHGDYTKFKIRPNVNAKFSKYIGVSKLVCDTFHELTGLTAEVAYNPLVIEEPKKVLHLISATRLTREKGADRIVQLANALDAHGVSYEWTIFTDSKTPLPNPNITFKEPKYNIIDYVADADYLVQLSDTEGYCFSVVEALSVGTPVIVTDCPVFREIGVEDGKNGFILDFDMQAIPITSIVKGLPKFKYQPLEDRWGDLLADGKSQYQEDMKKIVKIKITHPYYDLVLDRKLETGDVVEVSKVRADYIIENDFARFYSGTKGHIQDKASAGGSGSRS